VSLLADRAAELGKFLFQFEDAIATVDDEKVRLCLARPILAVAKPIEAIMNLAVPRCLNLPIHFLDIA
jgi:hypothetical protein